MGNCKWCGRANEDNPGDYYHEKDCHRRDVLRRLKQARFDGVGDDSPTIQRLERELERASNTGD